jgi:hypothetical protein
MEYNLLINNGRAVKITYRSKLVDYLFGRTLQHQFWEDLLGQLALKIETVDRFDHRNTIQRYIPLLKNSEVITFGAGLIQLLILRGRHLSVDWNLSSGTNFTPNRSASPKQESYFGLITITKKVS